jgi:hypothetical protein
MNRSDKDNMKIVDNILAKVIAGGILIGRAVSGRLDLNRADEEAEAAKKIGEAVTKSDE